MYVFDCYLTQIYCFPGKERTMRIDFKDPAKQDCKCHTPGDESFRFASEVSPFRENYDQQMQPPCGYCLKKFLQGGVILTEGAHARPCSKTFGDSVQWNYPWSTHNIQGFEVLVWDDYMLNHPNMGVSTKWGYPDSSMVSNEKSY